MAVINHSPVTVPYIDSQRMPRSVFVPFWETVADGVVDFSQFHVFQIDLFNAR